MNRDDALMQLRDINPVSSGDLSRVDGGALDALREGITMTDPIIPPSSAPRRRFGRGVAAGVLSLTLVGGGAAYAYQQWYSGGGDLTCFTSWADLIGHRQNVVGGVGFTGDPVADCQRYEQLAGRPAINDPVAFRRYGELVVGPRSEVPKDVTVLAAATPVETATRELAASLTDWVDGGRSRCLTRSQAIAFANAELERLNLHGWTVEVLPSGTTDPCTEMWTDESQPKTVVVRPHGMRNPDLGNPGEKFNPALDALRRQLRSQVADRCLSLEEATAVVSRILRSQHHWPSTSIPDSRADCTRIDLEVGGGVQVTLRGPVTTR